MIAATTTHPRRDTSPLPNGQVQRVLHHPDEHTVTLMVKKHIATMLQLLDQPLGHSDLYEQDARGNASAKYRVRRGLQHRRIYRKELEWAPTEEDKLRHRASVHAIVDRPSGILRKLTVAHLFTLEPVWSYVHQYTAHDRVATVFQVAL